jgi:hypothetical protein
VFLTQKNLSVKQKLIYALQKGGSNMSDDVERLADLRPSASVRWSARALSWFCWLGIASTVFFALLHLLNAFPDTWISDNDGPPTTLLSFGAGLTDPVANAEAQPGLRADWLNRIVGLTSSALLVWALFSARTSFVGVSRGQYFARSTILGLRNLSLAVLLYHTAGPIVEAIPRMLYFSRISAGRKIEISANAALNESIALIIIFAAVVALVSTVMAHAAKIADENRQFI